jgi:acetyltransferase-like isoleucine patch superfamily enzyme
MLKAVLRRLRRRQGKPLPPPVQDPTIPIDASGNRIRLADGLSSNPGFHLTVEGGDNYLDIQGATNIGHLTTHLGGGAHVVIGPGCRLPHLQIYASAGAVVLIGAHVSSNGSLGLFAHEPRQIVIGPDCLLASGVSISVSDTHSILDLKTGKRLNRGRDVLVGDHVWIGENARILKGARIGSGSVIGAYAIVTRRIPPHSVAAGNPARVVRREVRWVHELL